MKRWFIAALLLLLLSGTGWAGWEEGLTAYKDRDYSTAFREWLPLAEGGDVRAQNKLGLMYRNGWGVPQDDTEAVKWYRRAAEKGDASAQYSLGSMYEEGRGVPMIWPKPYSRFVTGAGRAFAFGQPNSEVDCPCRWSGTLAREGLIWRRAVIISEGCSHIRETRCGDHQRDFQE
jgi:TPR repeat protein